MTFLGSHREPKAEESTGAQLRALPGLPAAPERRCANQCSGTSHGSALSRAVTAIPCAFSLCLLWGVCVQEAELPLLKPTGWDRRQQHVFASILLEGGDLQRARAGEAFQCKYTLQWGVIAASQAKLLRKCFPKGCCWRQGEAGGVSANGETALAEQPGSPQEREAWDGGGL